MNAGTRILLLFDNNGAEYVSRIRDGVSRAGRASGLVVQAENLFGTGKAAWPIWSKILRWPA